MLYKLHITNYGIIDDVSIDLKCGFTTLFGKTGAGKSLIFSSISLLLGSRADISKIRHGFTSSCVEGYFSMNLKIEEFLKGNNICLNDNLHIKREISKSKSIIKINNKLVNLQTLKELSKYLGLIHHQQESYNLFNKENYLDFIDPKNDIKFNLLFNDYILKYHQYLASYNEYESIIKNKEKDKRELEYNQIIYNELTSMDLKENEDEYLDGEISKLVNFDNIYQALKQSINLLDNECFSLDNIYSAYKELDNISKYSSDFNNDKDLLLESYNNIEYILSNLKTNFNNLEYNENLLDELQTRSNQLNNLKLKYHRDVNSLLNYIKELELKINKVLNYDETLNLKYEELILKFESLKISANNLSSYRKNIAINIEQNIIKNLKELDISNAKFRIEFENKNIEDPLNKDIFSPTGIDDIEFLISTNKCEPLKPMSNIISGGEASRIMFSFKLFFKSKLNVDFIVFDEIDSGVSGNVANIIGSKIKELSKDCQVLLISHLPQVISYADNYLYVYKELKDERTISKSKYLNNDEVVEELAKMISGNLISNSAIIQAKELLNNNSNNN